MAGEDRDRNGLSRQFHRDRAHGKIAGVCAGIADYFGLDATLVRIAFVIGTLAGFGVLLLVYLAIWALAD